MAHTNSYPSAANVAAHIAAEQIEIVTAENASFVTEFNEMLWTALKKSKAGMALALHFPTATTANAVACYYSWAGEIKLFTPGAAITLTDDDVNYVWLDSAGALQTAIDGTGWPVTEHLKIAEVTLASGVITTVTDRRCAVGTATLTNTTSGITTGQVMSKTISTAKLELLLDTTENGPACSGRIHIRHLAGRPFDAVVHVAI